MRNLLVLLVTVLVGCSSGPTVAGGTSSSDNAKVMGIVVSSTNVPVAGAKITVMDGRTIVSEIIADGAGQFEINLKKNDSVSVFGQNGTNIGRQDIFGTDDSVELTIQAGGSIQLVLRNTEDLSVGDTVAIDGIPYSWPINTIETVNDQKLVTLTNVPAGTVPPVSINTVALTLAPVTVNSGDTTVVEIANSSIKPIWKFPLIVGVQERVITHFGGMDQFRDSLNASLKQVNGILRDSRLNGVIEFTADSIYEFSGTMASQALGAPSPFAYRYLLSDVNDISRGVVQFDYIWTYSSSFDFFTPEANAARAALFAETRGALKLSDIRVSPGTTPVTHDGYSPPNWLMSNASISNELDPYTIAVLNHNGSTIGGERDILHKAMVDTLVVEVVDSFGVPVRDAVVSLYPSVLESSVISQTPRYSMTTGTSGVVRFSASPFVSAGVLTYGTCLISVTANGKTGTGW